MIELGLIPLLVSAALTGLILLALSSLSINALPERIKKICKRIAAASGIAYAVVVFLTLVYSIIKQNEMYFLSTLMPPVGLFTLFMMTGLVGFIAIIIFRILTKIIFSPFGGFKYQWKLRMWTNHDDMMPAFWTGLFILLIAKICEFILYPENPLWQLPFHG